MTAAVAITMSAFAPIAALAQLTQTPGPGGIPIAPGPAVKGYDPGGIGLGGTEIAPGRAARGVPVYRNGPGDVPVIVTPEGYRQPRRGRRTAIGDEGCGGPCTIGGGVRLTIRGGAPDAPPPQDKPDKTSGRPDGADQDGAIGSVRELHAALRGCWTPPPDDRRKADMQMSVRFSFQKSGALVGPPFVTYATRGADADTRRAYKDAIVAGLDRCAPLKFSTAFAAAVAGQPISVRYVDDTTDKKKTPSRTPP